jgi:WD40 repeat protein
MYNVKGTFMKRNLTPFMILLVVQLVLWKGISIISPTANKNSDTQARSTVANSEIFPTTLKGHALEVSSAAIAADNNTVISGSVDNTIKIWNLRTGQLKRTLTGHTGVIDYLSVTPDGKYIVSAESKNVRIWNLLTGALIRELGNSGTISFVETSQDGKTLVIDGGTQIIKIKPVSPYSIESEITKYIISIFNLKTGILKNQLVHDNLLTKIEMSHSGNILVSGDNTGKLNIWNLRNGTLEKTLTGHESKIKSIAISPDEKTIASTEYNGQIKIWDLISGKLKSTFTGHILSYESVGVLIPDNNTLMSWNVSTNRDIKIWNLQTGELKYIFPTNQNSDLDSNLDFVKISSDGNKLITKAKDNLQSWELATGQLKDTIKIQGDILAFSPDDNILATRAEDRTTINILRIPFGNK